MAKYRVDLRIDRIHGTARAAAEHADLHLGEFVFDSMADLLARVEEFRVGAFGVRPAAPAPAPAPVLVPEAAALPTVNVEVHG